MSPARTILFLTSCPLAWGGSEELWAGAAERLHARGYTVFTGRSELLPRGDLHPRWESLGRGGVGVLDLCVRGLERAIPDAFRRFWPGLEPRAIEIRDRRLAARMRRLRPDLVVISQGQAFDGCHPVCLPEVCRLAGVPYVLVCQKAAQIHWPTDAAREACRRSYRDAVGVFFVSEHNHRTVERQLGMRLHTADTVRNPFMVKPEGALPSPAASPTLRLACVARMWPLEKGQDVLLGVLARERWRSRPVEVNFYGDGPMERGLEMAAWLGLGNVHFPGFSEATAIWRENHALVLPSRAEGLPLAQVEAMMCGRPVIVADAGGTAEIMRDGEHGFLAASATEDAFDDALERAWRRRDEWPAIGAAAAAHVRRLYPADPCGAFADRLATIVEKRRAART